MAAAADCAVDDDFAGSRRQRFHDFRDQDGDMRAGGRAALCPDVLMNAGILLRLQFLVAFVVAARMRAAIARPTSRSPGFVQRSVLRFAAQAAAVVRRIRAVRRRSISRRTACPAR